MVWGLCGFAKLKLKLADLAPVALGMNVTLMVQFPLLARVAGRLPHVFVSEKLAGLVPPIEMLLICSGAVPVLDRVTI